MGTIPTSPRTAVHSWCNEHIDIFESRFVDIGLTTEQAAEFKVATTAFGASLSRLEAARLAYQAAVLDANNLYTPMRRIMTQCVNSIRTFATNTNDPNVYVVAQVPPRANPSELPPPGQPFEMSVELLAPSGALQLRWKASNPRGTSGTSYIVRRKLPGEATFSFLGVTGERRFVDNDFIAGPDSVQYTVQGQRADRAGSVSEIFTVQFGRQGPGATVISVRGVTGETGETGETGLTGGAEQAKPAKAAKAAA